MQAGRKGRSRRYRSRGVTFTEICVAAAILAAAFVPIAGMIRQWSYAERAEKMQAKLASFISVKMNEYLVALPWPQCTGSGGWKDIPAAEMDGIEVQWKVDVQEIFTINSTFAFKEVDYHEPCPNGAESAGTTLTDTTKKFDELDLDTTQGGNSFLKEIELGVRWRWPGSDPTWQDTRNVEYFLTRRANLK